MDLCKICRERKHCREICPELNKEISARGISPRRKDKTYMVDIFYLEETKNPFNEFQKEVAGKLVRDDWEDFFGQLDFVEIMSKILTPREKLIIQLILEGFTQEEIGQKLKIVKSRVNFLLQRAKAKMKKFYLGGGEQNARNSVLPIGGQNNNKMLERRPFNVKLQSRIRELGLKNHEVAFACQIYEADFSRIINGRRKPNEKQKKRLCEFLKSSPEELDL